MLGLRVNLLVCLLFQRGAYILQSKIKHTDKCMHLKIYKDIDIDK